MPLLEITKVRHLTAMLRLSEKTAELVNKYAAFLESEDADTVIDHALNYVFAKDREFQDFLKAPESENVRPILRVRKTPQAASRKPAVAPASRPALARAVAPEAVR
jgi:hypothetical protein